MAVEFRRDGSSGEFRGVPKTSEEYWKAPNSSVLRRDSSRCRAATLAKDVRKDLNDMNDKKYSYTNN